MKCKVCGTRMHYGNFFKVLKDENFLRWHNKRKPVTTENIKNHKIGFVRSYFGTTESHQSRQSHQSRRSHQSRQSRQSRQSHSQSENFT